MKNNQSGRGIFASAQRRSRSDAPRSDATALIRDVTGRSSALCVPKTLTFSASSGAFGALDSYSVAMISPKIFVSEAEKIFPREMDEEENDTILLKLRQFDHFDLILPADDKNMVSTVSRWCALMKKMLNTVAKNDPRYIVFNELSFPNFWSGRVTELGTEEKRRKMAALWIDLDRWVQQFSTEHNAIIICGSHHDTTTFENICNIYFPDPESTCLHKKMTTARAVGENIKVPNGVKLPIYHYGDQRFSVLLCSDAFDLNIFMRQIWKSQSAHYTIPDIFFVPSYHIDFNATGVSFSSGRKRGAMLEACEQLSKATGAVVVFVNQFNDPCGHSVFCAGENILVQRNGEISEVTLDRIFIKDQAEKTWPMRQELASIFSGAKNFAL